MRRKAWASLLAGVLLLLPAVASAAIDFDGNANLVCLTNPGTGNYYCENDGAASSLSSFTINLLGGNDVLVVSGPDCSCTCESGAMTGDFVYGGNILVVNGGDGGDTIYGADGRNTFNGDGGADRIRTGSHNADTLNGGSGADDIIDDSGSSETITGGSENDTIRDLGCSFTSIDCGTGTDKCDCGGPSVWCSSATCEFTAPAISISCPGI